LASHNSAQLKGGVRQPNVRVQQRGTPQGRGTRRCPRWCMQSVCAEHLSLAAAEETAAAEQQCEQPSTIITATPINQRLQLREAAGASAPCGGANCDSMAVCSRARLHTQMHITKSGRRLLVGPLVSPWRLSLDENCANSTCKSRHCYRYLTLRRAGLPRALTALSLTRATHRCGPRWPTQS